MGQPASYPRVASVDRFFEFSVLGLLGSGYLAVVGSGVLDFPTAFLVGLGLLLRALLVGRAIRLNLSDRVVTAATIAYIGFYPLDYLFLSHDFVRATVHLIFYLAVAKVLTAKTNRDYFYIKVIAFLELLAASILSANLSFFVFLALFLLFAVATFSSSEIRRSARKPRTMVRGGMRSFHRRLAALTVFTALGILALTVGMFFVLPRTARAAFQRFASEGYHLPGFSNEIMLGQIGELKKTSTPVMRVKIETERPLFLKWRGTSLADFDGRRWSNRQPEREILKVEGNQVTLADDTQRRRVGPRINYEVHLQTLATDNLFIAGLPEHLNINARLIMRTTGATYHAGAQASDMVMYRIISFLEDGAEPRSPVPLTSLERASYLQLPRIDLRIALLANDVTQGEITEADRARALEQYLRRSYGYTTDLPQQQESDPLAHFLFVRRKGHCEYFASSMAVMLRTVGIPSRVVTGFQSGVYNPMTGWYLIRASDAHSWVEAFLPDRGWTTFDPTPPDPLGGGQSLFSRWNLYMDAAETFWQEWVLNYDIDQQLMLAARMEVSSRNLSSMKWLDGWTPSITQWNANAGTWLKRHAGWLVAAVFLLAAAFWSGPKAWRWCSARRQVQRAQRGQAAAGDATLLYDRMLRLLRRRGIEKPAWLTPVEFARVLPQSEISALVEDLTTAYNDLRFGAKGEAAPRIVELLVQLEKL